MDSRDLLCNTELDFRHAEQISPGTVLQVASLVLQVSLVVVCYSMVV